MRKRPKTERVDANAYQLVLAATNSLREEVTASAGGSMSPKRKTPRRARGGDKPRRSAAVLPCWSRAKPELRAISSCDLHGRAWLHVSPTNTKGPVACEGDGPRLLEAVR
ncbi:MAG: hypothetical protein BGO98_23845 [Myxococcales bacterium 68-20]|nr:MAG: hypothetical protein BGO98_23845 [Myxococcales bacterium 68-20]